MNKVLNPFFVVGKSVGKGLKVAALSAAAVASLAGAEHFLGELAPVLIGAIGGLPGMILAGAVPPLIAGALEAVRNFNKHRKITPEDLQKLIDEANAVK